MFEHVQYQPMPDSDLRSAFDAELDRALFESLGVPLEFMEGPLQLKSTDVAMAILERLNEHYRQSLTHFLLANTHPPLRKP